jgi:hypothetical protein
MGVKFVFDRYEDGGTRFDVEDKVQWVYWTQGGYVRRVYEEFRSCRALM